jgi:uncharacterized membrane protein
MDRKLLFLISVAFIAVICFAIGYFVFEFEPLWVIGGLLLVLFIPGYSLSLAIFPGDSLGDLERLAYTLGLSLIIVALGGLILHWTLLGLNPITWLGFLGIITLVAIIVAVMRSISNTLIPSWKGKMTIGIRQIIFLSFAILITVIACGVARSSASQQQSQGFTQLWLLPEENGDPNVIRIGITNMESSSVEYHLQVMVQDNLIAEWPSIILEPGKKWDTSVLLPPQHSKEEMIKALLFRSNSPGEIYRQVYIWRNQ